MALDPAAARAGSRSRDDTRLVWWWALAVGSVILAVAFFALSYTHADPDLWGHLRFGQDLLRTGDPRRADIYSYLSGDQPWINHEWLAELLFAVTYALAGTDGLIALKTGIGLLIVGLIYRHLVRHGVRAGYAGALVLLSTILLVPGLWTVRPHAFTYLALTLLLLCLVAAEEGHPAWLWALPMLFALWTNLHGGFLAGVGITALWALAHLATQLHLTRGRGLRWRAGAAQAIPIVAALLATLANPYGVRLWTFLLRTATVPRPEIVEWQPIHITSPEGLAYLSLLVVSWLGVASCRRHGSLPLLALLAVRSVLPLVALRHAMLFAIAVPILAGEDIGRMLAQHLSRPRPPAPSARARRLGPGLARLACVASAAVFLIWWPKVSTIPVLTGTATLPVRAIALLRESDVAGNLAIDFDWGEYALWHLGPRVKVSLDGRRETVYTDAVYQQSLHFMYGVGDWDAVLDEYDTDLALVSKARPGYNLMSLKPGWALVYEDPLCALFARAGSTLAAQLLATPPPDVPYDGEGLAFP